MNRKPASFIAASFRFEKVFSLGLNRRQTQHRAGLAASYCFQIILSSPAPRCFLELLKRTHSTNNFRRPPSRVHFQHNSMQLIRVIKNILKKRPEDQSCKFAELCELSYRSQLSSTFSEGHKAQLFSKLAES